MSVNAVSNNANQAAAAANNAAANANNSAAKTDDKKNQSALDSPASTYEKSKNNQGIDRAEVNKLLKESEYVTKNLTQLMMSIMDKQGKQYNKAWGLMDFSNIDPEIQEAAKKDIAEDGYFGVKATSERIIDFAKALSGGDPSKLGELREAIEKGFKSAQEAWGKELPQISKDTLEAVWAGLDEWEASFNKKEEPAESDGTAAV